MTTPKVNFTLLEHMFNDGMFHIVIEEAKDILTTADTLIDQIKLEMLISRSFLVTSHPTLALEYNSLAYQKVMQINDANLRAHVMFHFSRILLELNDSETALKFAKRTCMIYKDLSDNFHLSQTYNLLGQIYAHKEFPKKARDYYLAGLTCSDPSDKLTQLTLKLNLLRLSLHEMPLDYQHTLTILENLQPEVEQYGNLVLKNTMFFIYATLYRQLEDYDKFHCVLNQMEQLNDFLNIPTIESFITNQRDQLKQKPILSY